MSNSKIILTFVFLLAVSQSILLMVRPKTPRCMAEYITHDNFQSAVKIMIDFKTFPQPVTGQHFLVYIRNTENNWTTTGTVKPGGKYYEEIKFEKSKQSLIQMSSTKSALTSKPTVKKTQWSSMMPRPCLSMPEVPLQSLNTCSKKTISRILTLQLQDSSKRSQIILLNTRLATNKIMQTLQIQASSIRN